MRGDLEGGFSDITTSCFLEKLLDFLGHWRLSPYHTFSLFDLLFGVLTLSLMPFKEHLLRCTVACAEYIIKYIR